MSRRACSWISQGFETLLHKQGAANPDPSYDVVIIGSGYGGAMAASQLAGLHHNGQPLKICVLERGNEYLPGMFPSRLADLPRHVRFSTPNSSQPGGNRDALFDLRLSPTLTTVVANGLGGGSLINAGVMIEPKADRFQQGWPKVFENAPVRALADYYPQAKTMLGAADALGDNTIARHASHAQQPLSKHRQLQLLATDAGNDNDSPPPHFHNAAITMAMEDKTNAAGVKLDACNLCGDCATGCNHNAKDSLDTNLLVKAQQRGVELYTGATVLKISTSPCAADDDGWLVSVVHTKNKLRRQQLEPLQLKARKVILAAGSLGSTEILLRSQSPQLPFSSQLGQRFSSNGDMLASVYNQRQTVNAIADENQQPDQRLIGPTITGVIDLRDDEGLLIEEMAVPGALRRLYEELVTTSGCLANLVNIDRTEHLDGQPEADPYAVNAEHIDRTAIYAIMGDDGSQGSVELVNGVDDEPAHLEGDGSVWVRWSGLPDHPLFDRQIEVLEALVSRSGVGGQAQGNPAWRALPAAMDKLLGGGRGPLLTVHPLGGCGMGDDHHSGVVDQYGRVFNPADQRSDCGVHNSLVVLDGAMIPRALGANPALTIAAVSLRAIHYLRQHWGFVDPNDSSRDTLEAPARQRPRFADKSRVTASKPTQVEITERICGRVMLTDERQQPLDCVVDITLRFQPKPVLDFVHTTDRIMQVNSTRPDSELSANEPLSQVRIFRRDQWQNLIQQGASDECFSEQALLVAPVDGTLEIMARENSTYYERLWRATASAWLPNRGLRDSWQALEEKLQHVRLRQRVRAVPSSTPWLKRTWRSAAGKLHEIQALASHAGEMRLFDYQLRVHRPASGWSPHLGGFNADCSSLDIKGVKRISYTRAANPMRQFEDMHLSSFPGLQPDSAQAAGKAAYLRFDSRFLTQYHKPLIRIVEQQDQATALADMAAFFMYFARLLIGVHLWSFRKPDASLPAPAERLPGVIRGVAPPEIVELPVATYDAGLAVDVPVNVRLTRYPQRHSQEPPVVMIHGYSASGNTYTHAAIKTSLAQDFWRRGRDVWVLDLRTSSGMPTAVLPWSFEDVAFADIPLAIDHICSHTGQPQVDIIAHCMGAAMFSMAVLAPPSSGAAFYRERQLLPSRIHKAVLSQVGPRVVFSPENIFRAFTLSYAQQLMPYVFYAFQRSDAPGVLEQLLDRLLSALPYPDGEFEQENPIWPWRKTRYVGTRHRMDGLYGRTFTLANLSQQTLDHIDDLFGPLNMVTLSQVIQFALHERVTNRHGVNEFVTRERLQQFWRFPTLSVHGDQNGLADISTLTRMQQTMSAAGCDYQTQVLHGFGHQDALIGKHAKVNFDKMYRFLSRPRLSHPQRPKLPAFTFQLPAAGPVIGSLHKGLHELQPDTLPVSLGLDAQMSKPEFVVYVAVNRQPLPGRESESRWQLATPRPDDGDTTDNDTTDNDTTAADNLSQLLCVQLARPQQDRWLQQRLPMPPTFQQADGILVLLVDDQSLQLDQLSYEAQLPDNLLSLIDSGPSEQTNVGVLRLADYLRQHLLSPAFHNSLAAFLNQSASVLTPAVIELPRLVSSASNQLHFALGACQYTPGMLDRRPAYRSYRRLAERLNRDRHARHQGATSRPELLILTGDQVYTDASAGLLDPTDRHSRFTNSYHNWLKQPEVRSVLRRLPLFTMLDDHEILNDWDLSEQHLGDPSHLHNGRRAYLNFQRNPHQQMTRKPEAPDALWYAFRQQGFDFFMLDSRTERQGRRAGNPATSQDIASQDEAELISPQQMASLQQWLLARPLDNRPRFIVSPSMLLPRRRRSQETFGGLHSDAWDGYPHSLHQLLAFIAQHQLHNLVFLSGDEHLSSVVDITLTHRGLDTRVLSIHSSGLYAPFSFVNSTPDLFAAEERFAVTGDIECGVQSHFFPGDGFALISVCHQPGQPWVLECEFDREPMAGRDGPTKQRQVRRVLTPAAELQPS